MAVACRKDEQAAGADRRVQLGGGGRDRNSEPGRHPREGGNRLGDAKHAGEPHQTQRGDVPSRSICQTHKPFLHR
ncbi:MAG: hypothetical protein ACRDPF_06925 [Streptosporangiaceae bacterium]